MLYERGELNRYFEGDDLPGYALYTATWGLVVPHLAEAYPGNRKMGVQVQPHKSCTVCETFTGVCACVHF